jgi:hypothetical protein
MQIGNLNSRNTTAYSPAASKSTTDPAAFASLANYGSTKNTIFQNMLHDPEVADNIVQREDGSYGFVYDEPRPISDQECAARLLIGEQNGDFAPKEGKVTDLKFSSNDLMKFRQLTGYNLIQVGAGGGNMVVDDYGRLPAPADDEIAAQMWIIFEEAKMGAGGRDIGEADLAAAIKFRQGLPGADPLLDTLMGMVTSDAVEQA